uniref:Uncharacterized protein n=1 Tax=Cacopsylla melanoneura TaxID=428564 RepID=A0A8D8WN25_9HEMI
MIMTFMCLMMKIFQYSTSPPAQNGTNPPTYKLSKHSGKDPRSKIPRPKNNAAPLSAPLLVEEAPKKRFHKLRKIRNKIRKFGRFESAGTLPSGQRDLGSNADDSTTRSTMLNQKSADLNYNTVRSTDSFSSSQQNQLEFIQDNIDYQWFIDYGYRDGGSSLQRSSILSASCYDDLARDLDANLAHVDMEDFSHEDIHSLLHTLPPMCVRDMQERTGEMFASMVSTGDEGEESHPSLVKSGPLFSPVKECSLPPAGTYSVDSLDCDEMMITCQHPNKHNYTIAFQGAMMSSETCTLHFRHDCSPIRVTPKKWFLDL